MKHDAIAVVDFGGQYAHLIATKIRRLHVLAEILQPEDSLDIFRHYGGIIISGSPALSSKEEESHYDRGIFDLDIPILGFCFGHQEIAKHYGGRVAKGEREWGRADLHISSSHPLFEGLNRTEPVWMSHHDSVVKLGPDFEEIGYTIGGSERRKHRYSAIASNRLKRYGFQFHPEVDDTPHGEKMLSNFVLNICGCSPTWTMEDYLERKIEDIRKKAGEKSVFLLVSGGVDSTVAAKLLGMALAPGQFHLLHIDNGLMRKNESRSVLEMFHDLELDENLHFIDAGGFFLNALEGLVEPEEKRIAIGNTFVEVFRQEAEALGLKDHILAQGTIYPDTIETGGTKRADTIKTHHNRVPIIEEMIAKGKILEPLSELYKVEVRELGERLGIEKNALWRHPFPGPGLGIRLLCSTGSPSMNVRKGVVEKVAEIAGSFSLKSLILPIRSVGVKGDLRSYEHPVLLQGDEPLDRVVKAATVILSELSGINRCIWNLTGQTHSSAVLLSATVTSERLRLLREIDHLVMESLVKYGCYSSIWQCPTVLVPLEMDGKGRELVILRPVHSKRAMTAAPALIPIELISELDEKISRFDAVSGFCIDVTSKPPGTIEWE
ncbi:MAG: glutamine-hydrolyzing GMP synthase [Candidatus Thermoplasmatota archaeon]|nr:glutamine-hydrolyzing GMP synthase [Candidatus Thermoplasmatota archaeon]MDP7265987.1 glutamine-hydrolyzing GMP synthase [Candidatus Thermoplasmatota archaeon]